MSRTPGKIGQDIDRFLREINTDYLDILLMHYVTQADWPTRYSDAMDALTRAMERGKVRAVGVSCHGLGSLRAAADSDWVDVALVRVNHAGVNMDGKPDQVVPVIERMHRAGKAVYGMKVLGCGQLASDAHAAVEYVFGLGTVHAITIGTSKAKHFYHNLGVVEELAPRHQPRAQNHL
jgi:predicted aldo/keto reductase-like oxidoreductase